MFFDEDKILPTLQEKVMNFTAFDGDFCICISGGVDSVFLGILFSTLNLQDRAHIIIVDHDLRKTSSLECKKTFELLLKFGFKKINIIKWEHHKIETAIEESARIARYKIIQDYCYSNNILNTFLGHHADDQIETFFMNLFRGTGLIGLGCMEELTQKNGINFIRPLLQIRKKLIINFMVNNRIPWAEDETNNDSKFTRNRIRKIIQEFEIDDVEVSRICDSISSIQGVNKLISSRVSEFFGENIAFTVNGFEVKLREFSNLCHEEKIRILYKIFNDLNAEKPRFNTLQDIIILASRSQDSSSPRRVFIDDIEVKISQEFLKFSKN